VNDVLKLEGVTKSFGAYKALDDVSVDFRQGEVHGILGVNGSGKSTLLKCVAGYYVPDSGKASVSGIELPWGSPEAAAKLGIRFIHQDLGPVGEMSVIDNLALGTRYEGRAWVSDRRERRRALQLLQQVGIDVDPSAPVWRLTKTEKTMLAVARAMRNGFSEKDVLLLDEPTASLSSGEVRVLFELLRSLSRRGVAIGFVSHRLREVLEICDRVSVLRNGRCVASRSTEGLSERELIDLLVGAPLSEVYGSNSEPVASPRVLLEARGLRGGALHELDLTLHEGEVLGIAGLDGSGRELVSRLLVGADAWESGSIVLNGKTFERLHPDITVQNKVAYVPADRKSQSLLPGFSLRENLTLAKIGTRRKGWLSLRDERRDSAHWLDRVHVDQRNVELPISLLSGGNQQRVVIARWLRFGARVMVLDEPTQGVDVAGRSAIYDSLADASRAGTGLIIVSTDSEELVSVCDRVLVLFDGRVALDLDRDALLAGGTAVLDRAILSGVPEAEGVTGEY